MTGARMVASGREADLVDLGGGRLLRRPRRPRPLDAEVAIMRQVRAAGYPVPRVFELRPDGMVMERVDGPTMLEDLAAHPWRVGRHARTLAALHGRLHRLPVPDGLPARFWPPAEGDVLVHCDLHPGNVMLSPDGPVVIDWPNACRGPAGVDVADAWLLLGAARVDAGPAMRLLAAALRRRFLAVFLRCAGRDEAARHLWPALDRRLRDANLSEAEREGMRRLAARHGVGG